ncbi:MAG TPA: 23S rRNA (guanosine(2251)-2'-O)-methyltransferase RlmB [Syntrophomonadaceae bacterium]|nr:23S rRNA (guanosine(2251)-2'-O)-methyltransferase RlmB [Syntrophomonadaceae bacterium]
MKDKLAGVNSIMEAMRAGRNIHKIYIQEGKEGKRIEELVNSASNLGIYVQYVDRNRLDRMYTYTNHQGVVAQVAAYHYSDMKEILEVAAMKGEPPFILILDGIEDPQNLGSIIRTAECAGVHGVIIPKHNSVEANDTVARASAGAIEHMKVAQETNLVNTIKKLKEEGLWVVGADMSGSNDYYSTSIPSPTALVIGGEGRGIRRLVKENCDILVKIPMMGKIEALNASVAAALLIYEVVRQRKLF